MVRDRDFIYGVHTQLMMPFQMTPRSGTLTLTFVLKIAFLDFVATGGIVFHKHMYFCSCCLVNFKLKANFYEMI